MRYHPGLAVGHIYGHGRIEAAGVTCGPPQDNHAAENPETETELDPKSTDNLDDGADSDDPEFGLDNLEDDLGDDEERNDSEGEEEYGDHYEEEEEELQMSMYDMYGPVGVSLP